MNRRNASSPLNRLTRWSKRLIGLVTVCAALLSFSAQATVTNFPASGTPAAILDSPNNPGLQLTIPVTGITGTVNGVSLTITGFTHTWVGDLTAVLTNPAGITHEVFMRLNATACGGAGGGFGSASDLNGTYTFSDGAAGTLWDAAIAAGGGVIPSGSYRTNACATAGTATTINLAFGFPGAVGPNNINGNWTLTFVDNAGGDTGGLTAADLVVDWTAPPVLVYCIPDFDSGFGDSQDFEYITNVTYGGINNNSSNLTGAYEDYTAQTATATIGVPQLLSVTIVADFADYVFAYIDWNQDGFLDGVDEIYTLATNTSADGVHSVNVTPPPGATLGTTRMRVVIQWNQAIADPCIISDYGEAEDYSVNVQPPPPCLPPGGVAVVPTSTTSADVSWTGAGNFILEYGPAATFTTPGVDDNPGVNGTVVLGATSPHSIGGLTAGVAYRVFVRRDCGAGSYSVNSPGVLFSGTTPNDECFNAPETIIGAGASVLVSGTSFGATDNGYEIAALSWEKIVLTECVSTLELNWCETNPGYTLQFNIIWYDCPPGDNVRVASTNLNNCANGNRRQIFTNLCAGTYYVSIFGGFPVYNLRVITGASCVAPPPNDQCFNAIPIACGSSVNGTTINSTHCGAPFFVCDGQQIGGPGGGVWYATTGLCGNVTASLCSTTPSWDSQIFVFSGNCGNFACVDADDDGCGVLSTTTWAANPATTYLIYVTGFGAATGNFTLNLTCTNTLPTVASAVVEDNCGLNQFRVNVDVTDFGGGTPTISWVAIPGGPGNQAGVVGVNNLPYFSAGTELVVTVSNGVAGCTTNLGSYFSNCPVIIDCNAPALIVNHCYRNNDPRTFTYIASDDAQTILLTFISGTMEFPNDVVRAYSHPSPALPINSIFNSYPSLDGVNGQSSGDTLFMEISSNNSNSCADGGQAPWVFQVQCTPSCFPLEGDAAETITCGTYSFTVTVDVTGTGDGSTVDLAYTLNGIPQDTIFGLVGSDSEVLGPYAIGTVVNVKLLHETDDGCDLPLGSFSGTSIFCPPPGWTCALPHVVNSYPFVHIGTTAGSGNELGAPQCALAGTFYGSGSDYIYRLDITTGGDYLINLSASGTFGWFLKSSGNCTNTASCVANAVSGGGPTANGVVTLTGGTSYFLVIDSWAPTNNFAYTLNISQFTPLPGDQCNIAIPLSVNASCVPTAGSVAGMTQSIPAILCGGFTGTADDDIWYSFVATFANHVVTLDADFDAVIDVRSGACNGTSIGCADANFGTGIEQVILGGLTVGNTYYIRVYSWNAGIEPNPGFDICVTFPPPPATSETCAGVGTVPVAANLGACSPSLITSGATQDGPNPICGGATSANDDVWTSFVAPSNGNSLVFSTTAGSAGDWVMEIWDACGGAVVECDDDDGPGLMPLIQWCQFQYTPGATYYVRMFVFGTGAGGTASLCIYETTPCPTPPPNDLCANAIAISCNSVTAGTTVNGTFIGAPAGTCGTTLNTAPGVWYTVQGWDGEMRAYTCSPNTNYDTKMGVFTGTCGALVCVTGNDDDATCTQGSTPPPQGFRSRVTWAATSGTTYYIYVTGFGTASGIFDLTVECGDNNPACAANGVTMVLNTDANAAAETTWEIRTQGSNLLAVSGTGVLSNATDYPMFGCLPNGCYYLRALDTGGDGLAGGGYILREQSGLERRIIDNRNNWSAGSPSAIAGDEGFCLPISAERLVFTSCDKMDWRSTPCGYDYIVANDNPAVTAQYGVTNATSGYQMWWFNPNGGYSFKRIQYHNTANGLAASATRACHFKLNSWAGNQLLPNVMYNVKVRTVLNNVFGDWGSACRMKIDDVAAQCPATKLHDIPGESVLSCGQSRAIGTNVLVHARPVRRMQANCTWLNANRYQFRFRVNGQPNLTVIKTSNTNQYFVNTTGLVCGITYDVDVRASFNNGSSYCYVGAVWGESCELTTVCAAQGGNQNMVEEGTAAGMRMFPNPNRGDQLFLSVEAIEAGVSTVSVDIFDAFGKRAVTRTIPVTDDGFINTVLELNGSLATGLYMVNITAGETVYTERLVIQP